MRHYIIFASSSVFDAHLLYLHVMKKISLIVAILLAVCVSCKKESPDNKPSAEQAALAEEFNTIAGDPDAVEEDSYVSTSYLIEGTASVPVYYQRVNLYTFGGLTEFHLDVRCGDLAPSQRGLKEGYYVWTPGSTDTRNTGAGVKKAILRVSKAGGKLPRYSIALIKEEGGNTKYRIRHSTKNDSDGFPLKPEPFASDYSFPKSTVVSGKYLHLPVEGKTFDVLELTLDSRSKKTNGALISLHFVLTPIKSFKNNVASIEGKYSLGTIFDQWGDHKILSPISDYADKFEYFNKWGECSATGYCAAGEVSLSVSADKTEIGIAGQPSILPDFISSSSEAHVMNLDGISVKVSKVTEE